eukprot:TRINITY_DN4185_c0_g1_i5.p1 TRINITY_DN4185_c0_g1~~TRINITY_DN4185_c0_g1_i5.p1  ORF type:complete len:117 (+),score=12.77 TRINITY_DN4185_c0_g1_i5:287-637(+)
MAHSGLLLSEVFVKQIKNCRQIGRAGEGKAPVTRNPDDPSVKELKKRKAYVGKPSEEHERILIDKRYFCSLTTLVNCCHQLNTNYSVSIAETARRLDAEGYDGSYCQVCLTPLTIP